MDGWAGLHGLWRMKVIGRKAILILLLYWALKCRGANVFTVNASGLASDLGFMWTQMRMFYKRKYAHLCLHRRVQNLQTCRINSNSWYVFFVFCFFKRTIKENDAQSLHPTKPWKCSSLHIYLICDHFLCPHSVFLLFSSHIILDLIKYIIARIQFRQGKKDNIIILHSCFNGLDHKMCVGPFYFVHPCKTKEI